LRAMLRAIRWILRDWEAAARRGTADGSGSTLTVTRAVHARLNRRRRSGSSLSLRTRRRRRGHTPLADRMPRPVPCRGDRGSGHYP
jgi:hypothetical protein